MLAVRADEWRDITPDDCRECPHRICEHPDSPIYVPGLGEHELTECPRLLLTGDRAELAAVNQAIEAWRHWTKGNLAAFQPDASEALGALILLVDDEVGSYRSDLERRAREDAERKARASR